MTVRMSAQQYRSRVASETKEKDVSKAIKEYLDKRRIYNDRLNSGVFRTQSSWTLKSGETRESERFIYGTRKGTPDRFAIIRGGRVVFIECKRPSGKLRPEQVERIDELRRAGAIVIVAHSLELFVDQFEEIEPLKI